MTLYAAEAASPRALNEERIYPDATIEALGPYVSQFLEV